MSKVGCRTGTIQTVPHKTDIGPNSQPTSGVAQQFEPHCQSAVLVSIDIAYEKAPGLAHAVKETEAFEINKAAGCIGVGDKPKFTPFANAAP